MPFDSAQPVNFFGELSLSSDSSTPQEDSQLIPIPEVSTHEALNVSVSPTPRSRVREREVRKCNHGDLAILRVVKKGGQNHGRKFYSCPHFPKGASCDYFCWEEPEYLPGGYPSIFNRRRISMQKMTRGVTRIPQHSFTNVANDANDDNNDDNNDINNVNKVIIIEEEEKFHVATASSNNINDTNDTNNTNDADNGNVVTEPYDDLSDLRPEDVDPTWLQSVIEEEEQLRAALPEPETKSICPTYKGKTGALFSLKAYENWEKVPKFTPEQFRDVIVNHFMTHEGKEKNINEIFLQKDKALKDLEKTQEEVDTLKKELERSKLETNVEITQKRLLQHEKNQLEEENRKLKKRRL
ncbi:2544_t:CDS:1 [Diversispora eburnea]|uniref:2544_t:CDS:1 n=1 Tax=Diversispora eburnea TaxID=1213867 RepID=A0A9N8ZQF9_9GLOM|nr:2544_t:CDS:1 [Diversispora eburnea]